MDLSNANHKVAEALKLSISEYEKSIASFSLETTTLEKEKSAIGSRLKRLREDHQENLGGIETAKKEISRLASERIDRLSFLKQVVDFRKKRKIDPLAHTSPLPPRTDFPPPFLSPGDTSDDEHRISVEKSDSDII